MVMMPLIPISPYKIEVLSLSRRTKGHLYWWCVCPHCDIKFEAEAGLLRDGRVKACRTCNMPQRNLSKTKEYKAWMKMNVRCISKDPHSVRYYGNIQVCERWNKNNSGGFRNFLKDMGKAPTKKHTLDRKDNNGNYEPTNCRWLTHIDNCNNRRNSIFVIYRGERLTISQLARKVKAKYHRLWTLLRIEKLSVEEAIAKCQNSNLTPNKRR